MVDANKIPSGFPIEKTEQNTPHHRAAYRGNPAAAKIDAGVGER